MATECASGEMERAEDWCAAEEDTTLSFPAPDSASMGVSVQDRYMRRRSVTWANWDDSALHLAPTDETESCLIWGDKRHAI